MGCRCNKSTVRTRTVSPARRVTATTRNSSPSQLQALSLKAAEQAAQTQQTDFDRRKVEKLRREAIRRSLGR